ncbi:MAG: tetratricopeptide repeat protein [Urechidicola sp.]|nr:tetratricopeptide repeat protein [Urechidicola sp.]
MRKLLIILLLLPLSILSQKSEASLKKEARKLVREGIVLYDAEKYADAEVAFKKAIENDPNYEIANYNLGNALLQQNRNKEAIAQYELLAKLTKDKDTKAQTMHNIGNGYFKEKDYQKSVDAYKNSLRNNPSDDETRYNLALAQEMLEDQQNKDKDKNDDQNKDQNKDNKDEQKKDDQDKKEGEDEKDDQQNEDKNQDKQDPKDKKDEQKQPKPGQLSPQQIQQLLEAMNNEEKKTQEKMNAKKQKGKKVKQEKDW